MLVCELVCVRIRAFVLFFFVVCQSRCRVGFLCLCVCVFLFASCPVLPVFFALSVCIACGFLLPCSGRCEFRPRRWF